jgi:hypothetical protein
MLLVRATESSKRQTEFFPEKGRRCGVKDHLYPTLGTRSLLERSTIECDSHLEATERDCGGILSTVYWILGGNMGGINFQP